MKVMRSNANYPLPWPVGSLVEPYSGGGLGWGLFLLSLIFLSVIPALAARQTATFTAELSTSALQPGQTAVAAVVFTALPGYHVQSHTPLEDSFIKFEVEPDANPAVDYLDPIYPPGEITDSPALGKQSVYAGKITVYIPLRVKPGAPLGDTTLSGKITWQACNDQVCFPPEIKQPFSINTKIVSADTPVTPNDPASFAAFDPHIFATAPLEPTTLPSAAASTATAVDFFGLTFSLGASNIWLALIIALAVGLLFNLMPCVLPVVPLKAIGFFEVSRHNRARCFMLGIVFSLGIIAVFGVLAILIVAFRSTLHFSWGEQFKYGWFIWAIVAILLVMAAGMLGLFEVVLPSKIYELTPSHESAWGNFVFGMLAAVLSTPCTAPMFAGLLAWATAQPLALGVAVVMAVGVGMAVPYLLLSAFPELARWVPRTGPWSLVLKQMMGFLLIAVAVYFAGGRLASSKEFFWAVFAVVAVAMLFLVIRAFQLSKSAGPIIAAIISAIAVDAVALALTLRLLGGLDWKPYSQQAFAAARATGKPVLVEFTANWCGNCLALEASVYHDKKTAAAIHDHGVILLRADLTNENAPGWPVVNELNPGGGIPLTAIYPPSSDEPIKLTSLYTTQNLLDALDRASGAKG
jgi:thiol:disulfide interchange protein